MQVKVRVIGRVLAIAAVATLPARAAQATTVMFPNFSTTSGLTLSGSAAIATTSDGAVLRLTPAVEKLSGSAFGTKLIRVQDFSSSFSFRMTNAAGIEDCNGHVGADGFTFTAQPVSHSIGSNGGGLGIEGVTPAVTVEFDTFCNAGTTLDPSSNHIGVDIDGNVHSVFTTDITPFMNNGSRWYAWIDYDGALLTVRVSPTADRPATPQLSYPIDLKGTLGTDTAYVGFTASTGGGYQNHDVLNWTYFDHYMGPDGPDADAGQGTGGEATRKDGGEDPEQTGQAGAGAGGPGQTAGNGGRLGGSVGPGGAAGSGRGAGGAPAGQGGGSGCSCDTGGSDSHGLAALFGLVAFVAARRRRVRPTTRA
jgi:MYXO-CTERM domain-containing protein